MCCSYVQVQSDNVRKASDSSHSIHFSLSIRKVTDVGVCELARMCPLEEVILSGISGLTDRSVFALANCCTSTLSEMYASGCSMITQAAINYLKVTC